ncbi:NFACT family protein [Heliobacterium chlorum]|uniref:Rqc2 homolog RqcH n=1 Tax=Heliobacterium chlorum TaxID=2698 RepID=A0ABR7SXN7_HELCL|nr:NFACT family protein [Heliobacterium chlorum]
MALDGLTLTTIVKELHPALTGGRIDRIVQPLTDEIHLIGRTGPKSWRLLLSASPTGGRIHLTKTNKPNPTQPPLYCMVLRKHLEGGRIRAVEQIPWERVVRLRIEGSDELGGRTEKSLYLEIMGKHSNLILVDDASETILDGIRRYSHAVSRHREVLPGRPYIAPPTQEKLLPPAVTDESLGELLYQASEKTPVDKALQQHLMGISPETAREICFRAGIAKTIVTGECAGYEFGRLALAIRDLLAMVEAGTYTPEVVWENMTPKAFAPWPLLHLGRSLRRERYATVNEAIDLFYNSKSQLEKLSNMRSALLKRVAAEWDRVHRRKTSQEKDISAAEKDLVYRSWGELLMANLYRVQPGDCSITVQDFVDPDKTFEIELDPSLTPAENAQVFFSRYNKARQTVLLATEQKESTAQELAYLDSVLISLEQAENLDDLAEIRQELVQSGYLPGEKPKEKARHPKKGGKPGKGNKSPAKETAPAPKPLTLTTPEGWTIWVGRNNRQNDYLTMKMSRDTDIWLHTKDIPGAHVVIPMRERKTLPDSVLELAAMYSAYYSRSREADKVPVDYTERRFVRKPAGGKPGFVIYDHQQTLWVNPRKIEGSAPE